MALITQNFLRPNFNSPIRIINTMYLAAQPFTVGNDILDLGSRKAEMRGRQRQRSAMEPSAVMLGIPGQFDLPAVPNVSVFPRCVSYVAFVSL